MADQAYRIKPLEWITQCDSVARVADVMVDCDVRKNAGGQWEWSMSPDGWQDHQRGTADSLAEAKSAAESAWHEALSSRCFGFGNAVLGVLEPIENRPLAYQIRPLAWYQVGEKLEATTHFSWANVYHRGGRSWKWSLYWRGGLLSREGTANNLNAAKMAAEAAWHEVLSEILEPIE